MKFLNQVFRNRFTPFCIVLLMSCGDDKNESKNNLTIKDSLPTNESVNPYATHDQSPMDMSYLPPDYPVLRMNGTDSTTLVARLIYSRPQKKGRNIFGNSDKNLIQFGKEWRLGANEATEIEFFKTVELSGKKVEKGNYIIYAIPFPDKWTIVLNSNLYTWGLHMDPSKDILKIDIPTQEQSPIVEDFTMVFETTAQGANLVMSWDAVKTVIPILYKK